MRNPARTLRFLGALATLPILAAGAQATITATRAFRITGVALDSTTGTPLAGSVVQLADAAALGAVPHTATAGANGVFEIADVTPGRYVVALYHPLLDHFRIDAPTIMLRIESSSAPVVRLDLGASMSAMRGKLCGDALTADDGVIAGFVVDGATKEPLPAATVTAFWSEIVVGTSGFHNDAKRITATAGADGWFAACGVPVAADVGFIAAAGSDSSSAISVHVGKGGVALRDVAISRTGDAVATATYAVLNGVVRNTAGAPIAGARVRLRGSNASAVADDSGRFSVRTSRAGTQMLGTTAVGYFPDQRPVDVYAINAAELSIGLEHLRTVLDTIRVVGKRVYSDDIRSFELRQRRGIGKFFDAEGIARTQITRVTDIFTRLPGVTPVETQRGMALRIRGSTCANPTVYVDRAVIPILFDLRELDSFVKPEEIRGFEFYTGNSAPMEFGPGLSCGSIVIWTTHGMRGP